MQASATQDGTLQEGAVLAIVALADGHNSSPDSTRMHRPARSPAPPALHRTPRQHTHRTTHFHLRAHVASSVLYPPATDHRPHLAPHAHTRERTCLRIPLPTVLSLLHVHPRTHFTSTQTTLFPARDACHLIPAHARVAYPTPKTSVPAAIHPALRTCGRRQPAFVSCVALGPDIEKYMPHLQPLLVRGLRLVNQYQVSVLRATRP